MLTHCTRTGCAGEIEEGFCTDCGLAPAGAARVATQTVSQPSTPRTGSVASSPLSARTGTRSRGTRSSAGLGAGFVSLPPLPSLDPLTRVLQDPTVPENKRYCGACQKKVSLQSGFCPHCGASYSFEPTLRAGELVGGQYEVKGPIAFGGLGWIYLAQDQRLKQRWVVLKGLLNTQDPGAAQAALQEREFLSAVKHANIVSVYNFVTQGPHGYIVMEFVGGKTLSELRKERGPLPCAEAIAYIHRILAAFGYLHDAGMVYCDFKPSNVMVEEDVKLIDMGGVRRVEDLEGEVYGTKGFFAPEIGRGEAPTFASDLFTVARTLAVLVCDFDFQGKHELTIPSPEEEPLFGHEDSLYRFLLKATRPKPEDRFESAEEMAEQLLLVLREVASESGATRAVESRYFEQEPGEDGLPGIRLDATDPAAAAIVSARVPDSAKRVELLTEVAKKQPASHEARLRLAEALARHGAHADADTIFEAAHAAAPRDWRVAWLRGRALLAQEKGSAARVLFERVRHELPGEVAPRLAIGLAAEQAGDKTTAAHAFDAVSRCDALLAEASFGLARCLEAAGDRAGALEALGRVPATSSAYAPARAQLAKLLTDERAGEKELVLASETIEGLAVDAFLGHRLRADLLVRAARLIEAGRAKPSAALRLLSVPFETGQLRAAAEKELRLCARHAETAELRIELVDRANRERPFTLI
jgi:serine/threonine-protein kinase PknG